MTPAGLEGREGHLAVDEAKLGHQSLAPRAYTRLPFLEAFGSEFDMARCEFLIEHQDRFEHTGPAACSGRSRDESVMA
jgi:hypothetical protein